MEIKETRRLHFLLFFLVLVILVWSAIAPYDRVVWWLEVAPILIAAPLLAGTYGRFRFTTLVYALIALHCIILAVGGHYTYARVPLFDDIKEWLQLTRNHYDRLGHFAQGFIPAMVARELLLRTSPLRPGFWLASLVILSCLGISALYELAEWAAAVASHTGAEEFLATQGDVWDTQKDMAMALLGACCALLTLSRLHDRVLAAKDAA